MKNLFFWGLCFVFLKCLSTTVIYPHLQWDPRNPFFKGNRILNVEPMSRINIVCPSPALVPAKILNTNPKERLYENFWIVDKASYDACSVDTSKYTNRLVKKCNDPLNINYYTLVFRQFSAIANGLEFIPGKEYYFISTSDGTAVSLGKTSGGHCASHNMKMAVYLCLDSNDPKCKEETPTTATPVTCPTQPIPTTTAPTQLPSCADSSAIISIHNNTMLVPGISNQTALIPDLLSALQNLETKLNRMENKLDNCSAAASKCSSTAPPTPEPFLESCQAYYTAGNRTSGVYTIKPADGLGTFDVFCDQTKDGGGWTVIQKRFNGKVIFSSKNWANYSNGFGSLKGEFWLGLDKIHRLTATPVTLRIDLMAHDGEKRFAEYSGFKVGDAASKYKLTSGTYSSGTAGDSLSFTNGAKFSAVDQDNDSWGGNSCAVYFKSGWWHTQCHKSSLNGVYRNGSHPSNFADGLTWESWKGYTYSLTKTDMKIKA